MGKNFHSKKSKNTTSWCLMFFLSATTAFLMLALIEGISSLIILLDDTRDQFLAKSDQSNRINAAEYHSTQYDPDLGWVAIPHFDSPNFYGPGRDLKTDKHGFRSSEEIPEKLLPEQNRIVCSGDSFTLGYGVANDDTWCHQLGLLLNAKTVNMGQGGYGIDQAYLWYLRDGIPLDHQIHLLAFIGDDFRRAQKTETIGFSKPRLELINEKLAVTNVPVPRKVSSLKRKLKNPVSQMRFVRLGNAIRDKIRQHGLRNETITKPVDELSTQNVITAMFEDLDKKNKAKNSKLILVYLPVEGEHNADLTPWRVKVKEIALILDIPFIDLQPHLSQIPQSQLPPLFIQPGTVPFTAAAGHYSAQGNRWAANIIKNELRNIPEVQELIKNQHEPTDVR